MIKENLAFIRLEVMAILPEEMTPFGKVGASIQCRAINKQGKPIGDTVHFFDAAELILPGAGVEELKAIHAYLQAKTK